MDRAPKKPPFPVGTRLRYVGSRQSWRIEDDGTRTDIEGPGVEVTIVGVRRGTRGTLRPIPEDFQDDYGDPILDRTRDGASIYQIGASDHGRMIFAENASDWEVM